MVSEIAENRLHEFLSIHHLGLVKDGKDDTESPAARTWSHAHENHTFSEKDGVTEVVVDVDITAQVRADVQRPLARSPASREGNLRAGVGATDPFG